MPGPVAGREDQVIAVVRHAGVGETGGPESVRRALALLLIVARGDARRPASWIACVAAAAAAFRLAGGDDALAVARAVACGGLAAAAAVGSLTRPGVPRPLGWLWWLSRAAWPVAAALAVAATAGGVAALILAAAAALTTLAHAVATNRGATPVDATGVALALAAAAAGAAASSADAGLAAGGAAACFGVLAAVALAVGGRRSSDPFASILPVAPRDRVFGGSPLARLAMASTLAAMVICYFLIPELVPWFVAVSVGWFVVLAVPAATLGPGAVDAENRDLLVRSAAGVPRLSGAMPHALAAIAAYAAILGWPAGVAAVVRGPAATEPWGPLVAVLALVLLAVTTAASVSLASRCRASGDSSLALISAWLIGTCLA